MHSERAEVVAVCCVCLSPCEPVHDSTWKMLALSHWNLAPSHPCSVPQLEPPRPSDPRDQRAMCEDELPETLASACTCGLRRVLGEGHYIIMGDGAEPRSASRLQFAIMWGWVSFRVRCASQKSSTLLCQTATCTMFSWRDSGCICSLITLLWHLQYDLTVREYDCMVLVSCDGYLIRRNIHFGSVSVRFHRYELSWLAVCVSHSYKRSSIHLMMLCQLVWNQM